MVRQAGHRIAIVRDHRIVRLQWGFESREVGTLPHQQQDGVTGQRRPTGFDNPGWRAFALSRTMSLIRTLSLRRNNRDGVPTV
jgi:hypothetical protein